MGQAWEVKLTIPADTPPEKAKAMHVAWLAEVEGRVATLRASKRSKGQDLSQREADALAGELVSVVHRAAPRQPLAPRPLGFPT
jgi:hypothetical protein